jgi:hypothetical protein
LVADVKCYIYLLDALTLKVLDKKATKFASLKPRKFDFRLIYVLKGLLHDISDEVLARLKEGSNRWLRGSFSY